MACEDHIIEVPPGVVRIRLEEFLLGHFAGLSKMYVREVVRDQACQVNGRIENIGFLVRGQDLIEITIDPEHRVAMRPEAIPLNLIYEDRDLIVVEKPSGMLVHPSHREHGGTLLNALAHHFNGKRPGLPHRLDKQTSGLIVVAKNARAHRILSGHFMNKRVEKRYLALLEGTVEDDHGTIKAPIGRYDELKHWGVKEDGKHAETRFTVLIRNGDTTLLELEPVTGRTNQLRIHCELMGHPIVGDLKRGGRNFARLCLHASRLAFPHPTGGEMISFESQMPVEFRINSELTLLNLELTEVARAVPRSGTGDPLRPKMDQCNGEIRPGPNKA